MRPISILIRAASPAPRQKSRIRKPTLRPGFSLTNAAAVSSGWLFEPVTLAGVGLCLRSVAVGFGLGAAESPEEGGAARPTGTTTALGRTLAVAGTCAVRFLAWIVTWTRRTTLVPSAEVATTRTV